MGVAIPCVRRWQFDSALKEEKERGCFPTTGCGILNDPVNTNAATATVVRLIHLAANCTRFNLRKLKVPSGNS